MLQEQVQPTTATVQQAIFANQERSFQLLANPVLFNLLLVKTLIAKLALPEVTAISTE
jgi:hypothetical protein